MVYVPCKRCGKITRQNRADRQYCSEECRRPTLEQECKNCGKRYRVRPSYQGKTQVFCSVRCYRRFTGETEPERGARLCLEALGIAYEQERVIPGWRYPVDFYLPRYNTCLEIDGMYWHNQARVRDQDARKTLWLQSRGYRVIRLPDTPFYGAITDAMVFYLQSALDFADNMIAQSEIASLYPIQLALPLDQEGMF